MAAMISERVWITSRMISEVISRNLSRCQFCEHRFLGAEPKLLRWEAGD